MGKPVTDMLLTRKTSVLCEAYWALTFWWPSFPSFAACCWKAVICNTMSDTKQFRYPPQGIQRMNVQLLIVVRVLGRNGLGVTASACLFKRSVCRRRHGISKWEEKACDIMPCHGTAGMCVLEELACRTPHGMLGLALGRLLVLSVSFWLDWMF